MFRKRSKCLFASTVIATLYTIYYTVLYYHNFEIFIELLKTTYKYYGFTDFMVSNFVVIIFTMFIYLGTIFNWISFFTRKHKLGFLGSWMYIFAPISILGFSIYFKEYGNLVVGVSLLLYITKFIACIPLIIVSFIGSTNQKKIRNEMYKNE